MEAARKGWNPYSFAVALVLATAVASKHVVIAAAVVDKNRERKIDSKRLQPAIRCLMCCNGVDNRV